MIRDAIRRAGLVAASLVTVVTLPAAASAEAAGLEGRLSECSVYGNEAAGRKFTAMLAKGASQPWQDALFELTGTREIDASAILEYFAPLRGWLAEQNKGPQCGW